MIVRQLITSRSCQITTSSSINASPYITLARRFATEASTEAKSSSTTATATSTSAESSTKPKTRTDLSKVKWFGAPPSTRDHIRVNKPMPTELQEQIDEAFEDVYDRKFKKALNFSEVAQVLNDAQRRFFSLDDVEPSPEPVPDEQVYDLIQERKTEYAQQIIIDKVNRIFPDVLTWGPYRRIKVGAANNTESWTVMVFSGNGYGLGGFGLGKSTDPAEAARRAKMNIMKNLLFIPREENRTIPFEVTGRHHKTFVVMRPTRADHGIVASNDLVDMFEMFGLKDITCKIHGRRNPISVMYAVFDGLSRLRSRREIAEGRGATIHRIFHTKGDFRAPTSDEMKRNTERIQAVIDSAYTNSVDMRARVLMGATSLEERLPPNAITNPSAAPTILGSLDSGKRA